MHGTRQSNSIHQVVFEKKGLISVSFHCCFIYLLFFFIPPRLVFNWHINQREAHIGHRKPRWGNKNAKALPKKLPPREIHEHSDFTVVFFPFSDLETQKKVNNNNFFYFSTKLQP